MFVMWLKLRELNDHANHVYAAITSDSPQNAHFLNTSRQPPTGNQLFIVTSAARSTEPGFYQPGIYLISRGNLIYMNSISSTASNANSIFVKRKEI